MSMKKPWARPQDFSDIPGCQRVVCNVYLQQYPELALIMWFAAPGTRSQLTVRLLVAGLAAMNGQVDPENPEPAPPLPPRRTRTQAASPVEPARSGRKFPSSLATPPDPSPAQARASPCRRLNSLCDWMSHPCLSSQSKAGFELSEP